MLKGFLLRKLRMLISKMKIVFINFSLLQPKNSKAFFCTKLNFLWYCINFYIWTKMKMLISNVIIDFSSISLKLPKQGTSSSKFRKVWFCTKLCNFKNLIVLNQCWISDGFLYWFQHTTEIFQAYAALWHHKS